MYVYSERVERIEGFAELFSSVCRRQTGPQKADAVARLPTIETTQITCTCIVLVPYLLCSRYKKASAVKRRAGGHPRRHSTRGTHTQSGTPQTTQQPTASDPGSPPQEPAQNHASEGRLCDSDAHLMWGGGALPAAHALSYRPKTAPPRRVSPVRPALLFPVRHGRL